MSGTARAESLSSALEAALNDSPAVRAARARLAEAEAAADIERAAGRLALSVQGDASPLAYSATDIDRLDRLIVTFDGELPLYAGGRVRNMVSAARSRVEAAKADVARAEGNVLTEVATAFMAVIRDTAVVELDRGNVARILAELRANIALRRGGSATVTDIRQSEARLAGAQARFWSDCARLASSEADFFRLTGHAPAALRLPDRLPPLPDRATLLARAADSPAVVAAVAQARAARYDLRAARAERRPTLSLVAETASRTGIRADTAAFLPDVRGARAYTSGYVGLRFRLPIFGNGVSARIRQRYALSEAAAANVHFTRRQAAADAVSGRSRVDAAVSNATYTDAAVTASRAAAIGVRKERSVGQRTALDVLNAEQELRDDEVRLISARTDAFSAAAATLNAVGEARALLDDKGSNGSGPGPHRLAERPRAGDHHRPVMIASRFDLATVAGSRLATAGEATIGPRLAYAPEVMEPMMRLPYRAV